MKGDFAEGEALTNQFIKDFKVNVPPEPSVREEMFAEDDPEHKSAICRTGCGAERIPGLS